MSKEAGVAADAGTGPKKYASMAEFKKGISIGTWGKGADGKMGIQPNQAPSNAAAAPAAEAEAEEEADEDI